jgi:hypothetical protein
MEINVGDVNKYRRQMKRGLAELLAGIGLTVLGYAAATGGGRYTLFIGLIVIGVIELCWGAIGVAANKGKEESESDGGESAKTPGDLFDSNGPARNISPRIFVARIEVILGCCFIFLIGLAIMIRADELANKILGLLFFVPGLIGLVAIFRRMRGLDSKGKRRLVCRHCSAKIAVPKDAAGGVVLCPECGKPTES